MGDATATIAAARPEIDFLGIEVHPPGVGALLKRIGELGLANLRIVQHDAVEVLRAHGRAGIAGRRARVLSRPVAQAAPSQAPADAAARFVRLLASRLAPGATLHCATDWENYAAQMLEVLSAEPTLRNTAAGYAERPALRPLTKFENRGLGLGHGVWDLVFEKR